MESSGFLAKYPGNKCLLCGLTIHAGHDHIVGLGAKGHYRHADCSQSHRNAAIREALATKGLPDTILWIYAGATAGTVQPADVNDWITYAQEVDA